MDEMAVHLLALIGASMLLHGATRLKLFDRAKDWVSVEGVLLSISETWREESLSEYQKLKYFYPLVKYEYQQNGNKYTSNQVCFEIENIWVPEYDNIGGKIPDEGRFWKDWKAGQAVDVYFNPFHPEEAVLKKTLKNNRKSHHIATALGGGILIAIWATLVNL